MNNFWAELDLDNFGKAIYELTSGQRIEKVEVNIYFRRLAIRASVYDVAHGLELTYLPESTDEILASWGLSSVQELVSCLNIAVTTSLRAEEEGRNYLGPSNSHASRIHQEVRLKILRTSIAVLPPIEESTIASSEVGICTNLIPRLKVAATKPIMSPITPPPKARSTDLVWCESALSI